MQNSWTKEGKIHALLHNGKTVKITEGNLKIVEDAAAGSAPVLDIEMSPSKKKHQSTPADTR